MHHTNQKDRRKELSFFDADSLRSIAALSPQAFARALRNLWEGEHAHLIGMTERQLLNEMRLKNKYPTAQDRQLRLQFWFEYERSQGMKDYTPEMNFSLVIGHIISKEAFYRFHITDPHKLAFMLCPPADYSALIRTALVNSIHMLEEIMEAGTRKDPIGFANTALKIHQTLVKRAQMARIKEVGGSGPGEEFPKGDDQTVPETPQVPTAPSKTPEQLMAEIEAKKKMLAVSPPAPEHEE